MAVREQAHEDELEHPPLPDDRALDFVEDLVRGLHGRGQIDHEASTRSRRLDQSDDDVGSLAALVGHSRRTKRLAELDLRVAPNPRVRRRREREREAQLFHRGGVSRHWLGLPSTCEGISARGQATTHEVQQREPDEHGEHPDLEPCGGGALARSGDNECARDEQAEHRGLEESPHHAPTSETSASRRRSARAAVSASIARPPMCGAHRVIAEAGLGEQDGEIGEGLGPYVEAAQHAGEVLPWRLVGPSSGSQRRQAPGGASRTRRGSPPDRRRLRGGARATRRSSSPRRRAPLAWSSLPS